MLSGNITSHDSLPESDPRRHYPRFQPEAFATNIQLVEAVRKIAKRKGCTPAQLAINWTRCLGKRPGMPVIIPVPGSSSEARIQENATVVELTDEEMKEIYAILEKFEVVGGRYPEGWPTEG